MAKIAVYNLSGEKMRDLELNDQVFAVPSKKEVVHQVYTAMHANARQPWADTKDRSEVRGGGKKPWKQKGTGRARHGSTRSPIWSGGGITFGPLSIRTYTQKINKKMKHLALKMVLSDKVKNEKMTALESLELSPKTNEVARLVAQLPGLGRTTLLVAHNPSDALLIATRNIPRLHVIRAQDVNVVDLLHHQYIIVNSKSVEVLEQRLNK